jgi:hypothetical protein
MRAALCAAVALVIFATSHPSSAVDFGWWRSEYPSLLAKLATAPDHRLQTAYTNEENGQVKLELSQSENQSVLLIVDNPGESVWKYDETGHLVYGSGRMIFFITDSDRDGMPDTFTYGPSRSDQSAHQRFSLPDDAAIAAAWGIGIGYCVNWFLHDHLDAAFPARPRCTDSPCSPSTLRSWVSRD